MAKRPTITTVSSGYTSQDTINTNFENVRDQFDNTLSLDGSTPNAMGADLDMNNNDILNAKDITADSVTVDGKDIGGLADQAAASASAAATSETNAATSETNAANSETNAAASAVEAASEAAAAELATAYAEHLPSTFSGDGNLWTDNTNSAPEDATDLDASWSSFADEEGRVLQIVSEGGTSHVFSPKGYITTQVGHTYRITMFVKQTVGTLGNKVSIQARRFADDFLSWDNTTGSYTHTALNTYEKVVLEYTDTGSNKKKLKPLFLTRLDCVAGDTFLFKICKIEDITGWYGTRADFVSNVTNHPAQAGDIVTANGHRYVYVSSSYTDGPSDLPGWKPVEPLHPEHFGIEHESASSQNTKVTDLFDYVDSLHTDGDGGGAPSVVDFAGYSISLDNTLDFNIQRRTTYQNGTFKALTSANWTATTYMAKFTDAYAEYHELFFDCQSEAVNGVKVLGGRTGVRINVRRMNGGVGIWVPNEDTDLVDGSAGPEVWLDRCTVTQWEKDVDSEFTTDGNYTATCFKIDKTDTKLVNCTGRWARWLVDLTDLKGPCTMEGGHFYNGGATVVVRTNAGGIKGLDQSTAELTMLGTYIDNCTNVFQGSRVNGKDLQIVLDSADVSTSGLNFFEFDYDGETHPRCNMSGHVIQWATDANLFGFTGAWAEGDTSVTDVPIKGNQFIRDDIDTRITASPQGFVFNLSPTPNVYSVNPKGIREQRLVSSGERSRLGMLDKGTSGNGPYIGSYGDDLEFGPGAQIATMDASNSGRLTLPEGLVINGGFLNTGGGTELTIAGGVITATEFFHTVDTQADASTDDLDTINGGTIGDILILRAENSARTVVVKNGTGNINCGSDRTLNNNTDRIILHYGGTNWNMLAFSDNGT